MKIIIGFIVLWPLVGFLLNGLGRNIWSKKTIATQATGYIFASFVFSLIAFWNVQEQGAMTMHYFDFINTSTVKIPFDFRVDALSSLFLLVITGVGTLIHLYSSAYMHEETAPHYARYFAYLNLFIFSMLLLVLGDNYVIMFIGWEGVGLCSYLLIGFWHKNQDYNDAAKKAFIMNRIGDLGLLIGIIIIASLFNTADFIGIHERILDGTNPATLFWVGIAAFALFIGATGKSAQIPLYTWLPDAMAGPTPVSALIHAATMVTAGIFMITRLNFLFDLAPQVQNIIAIIGAITALVAATIGLLQNDIKKVLAYSTVSQLGLMFLALGLGAYQVAVFHVITHAFFKACLFLGSGSVIHALHGEQDMRKMGGLKKVMPITFITMLISSLAISGIFPFAGFWSKDEILMTAFHENLPLWIIGSVASIMTAFYMFRLMYLTFFKEFRGTEHQKSHLHESPALITIPLIVLALLATFGGLINFPGSNWLNHYLQPIISKVSHEEALNTTSYILMGIALVGAIVGITIAYVKYIKKSELPSEDENITGISKIIYNKYYVDEAYTMLIVNPLNAASRFFRDTLETRLSKFVFGFGKATEAIGTQGRKVQSGSIGLYLFAFVLGVCVILTCLFIAQ